MNENEKYMKEALKEAQKAYKKLEIPVGAVIVKDGKIIAKAHNIKEQKKDTTKHAEIIAIQKASKKLNTWRLNDCEMYVTLEPCAMCMAAIELCRLKKIYFFVKKDKEININLEKYNYLNNTTATSESLNLIHDFFKKIR